MISETGSILALRIYIYMHLCVYIRVATQASIDNDMGPMSTQASHGGYGGFMAGAQTHGNMGTGSPMGFSASSDPLNRGHQSPNSRLGPIYLVDKRTPPCSNLK